VWKGLAHDTIQNEHNTDTLFIIERKPLHFLHYSMNFFKMSTKARNARTSEWYLLRYDVLPVTIAYTY